MCAPSFLSRELQYCQIQLRKENIQSRCNCTGFLVLNTQSLDRRMARVRPKAAHSRRHLRSRRVLGAGWACCSSARSTSSPAWPPWWSSRTQSSKRLSTSLTRWRKQWCDLFVLDFVGMSFVCFSPQQKSVFTATSKCLLADIALFALVSSQQLLIIPFKVVFNNKLIWSVCYYTIMGFYQTVHWLIKTKSVKLKQILSICFWPLLEVFNEARVSTRTPRSGGYLRTVGTNMGCFHSEFRIMCELTLTGSQSFYPQRLPLTNCISGRQRRHISQRAAGRDEGHGAEPNRRRAPQHDPRGRSRRKRHHRVSRVPWIDEAEGNRGVTVILSRPISTSPLSASFPETT